MRLLLTVVTLHAHRLVLVSPPHFTLFAPRSRRALRAAPDHRALLYVSPRARAGGCCGRAGWDPLLCVCTRGSRWGGCSRAPCTLCRGTGRRCHPLRRPPPFPPRTRRRWARAHPPCALTRSGGGSYPSCAEVAAPVAVRLAQPFAEAAAPVALVLSVAAAVVAVGVAAAALFCFLRCLGVGGLIAGGEGHRRRGPRHTTVAVAGGCSGLRCLRCRRWRNSQRGGRRAAAAAAGGGIDCVAGGEGVRTTAARSRALPPRGGPVPAVKSSGRGVGG